MAIHIDVVADLDRTKIREAAGQMQRDLQKAGTDGGNALDRGLGSKIPKVEKALDKATAASGKFLVEQEKLNAIMAKGNATHEQKIRQSERVANAYRQESNAIREVAAALDDNHT